VTVDEPLLRVVAGQPTSEEVAALTVALSLVRSRAAAARATGPPAATSGWARRSGLLRAPLVRGPGAWRRSTLPS
jgi:hypothetical protein